MILQALNRYYDILLNDPDVNIAPFGYSAVSVSFALNISLEGELLDVFPQFVQEQRGKKTVEVPKPMVVPASTKRSVNVAANFLCDNTTYVLGISNKDESKPKYSRARFDAFRQLHQDLLRLVNNDAAHALLAFFDRYDPSTAREHSAIAPHLEALLKGGNLVFLFQGAFVHDDPAIRQVWEDSLASPDAEQMQCLVTGEIGPVARLHPSLKRVRGAQPTGATLVGFNAAAYESYNRSQGLNSPVGEKAAFAYTTTLNYLLSDANPNKKFYLGDTTVVYWAESENRAYEATFASLFDPTFSDDNVANEGRRKAETTLKAVTDKVRRVQILDLDALLADLGDENPHFYILGLAPNAARVSVRFFIADPFENVVQNIMAHYRDLKIEKEHEDQPNYLTVWRILNETVSKKSRDKDAAPLLAGAVFRAVLTNTPYPAALYNAIITRIRADMDDSEKHISKINYVRAAVIKAFLLRKYRHQAQNPIKEVLTMALNEQSTNPAYVLGRLFAWLERAQKAAIGKDINATIKDRYFTSACANPASVFPVLLRLAHHHFAKAEYGKYIENQIESLLAKLEGKPFPSRLTLDEQGVFILGYYHQRAVFYAKKEDPAAEPAS